jgi:hypothetical protein
MPYALYAAQKLQCSPTAQSFDAIAVAGSIVGYTLHREVYRDRVVSGGHLIGDKKRLGPIAVAVEVCTLEVPVRW